MSNYPDWFNHLNCAITICDRSGKIVYINEKASKTFEKWGGKELFGKSLFDCHNKKSVEIIGKLMANGESNSYTIEKQGVKKLIYQTPWYANDEVAGLIEFSIEIPFEMPHFNRNA